MKPIHATPAQQTRIKDAANELVKRDLLFLRDSFNMEPISGACTMAEAMIFTVAEVNRDAAITYFRASLDALELGKGPKADAAYRRRAAAFDELVQTVMLSRQKPEGTA